MPGAAHGAGTQREQLASDGVSQHVKQLSRSVCCVVSLRPWPTRRQGRRAGSAFSPSAELSFLVNNTIVSLTLPLQAARHRRHHLAGQPRGGGAAVAAPGTAHGGRHAGDGRGLRRRAGERGWVIPGVVLGWAGGGCGWELLHDPGCCRSLCVCLGESGFQPQRRRGHEG